MSDYRSRVQRGAALLDQTRRDWWARVPDPASLVMWHPKTHILFYALGDYSRGLAALGMLHDREAQTAHGFALNPCDGAQGWGTLAILWHQEATARIPARNPRPMATQSQRESEVA